MIKLPSKRIRHMNTAIAIRGHDEEGGEENTSESLGTNDIPSILLTLVHRARARPRTPAAPARLIARPPVAVGAPPVEVDVPEPEAELEVELLLEADLVWVAVEVKVSWAEEAGGLWPVERGVDEAPELLP